MPLHEARGLLRAVIGAVDFDRGQFRAGILELFRVRQALGKERASPRLVRPAADADPDFSRGVSLCGHVESSICARPRPCVRQSVRRGPTASSERPRWACRPPPRSRRIASAIARSERSGAVLCPTGGTPPMAKPVASRTKSASARAIGSPTAAAAFFSSTRSTPEAMTSTARPLVPPRKISDLAISATSQPIAAAASAAVRVLASNSSTWNRSPSAA